MAGAKPDLTRAGTMQVTAKEGIEYLESSGKDKLLEMQGLKDPAPEKPSVPRDSTMAVTAKEGIAYLQSSNDQKLLQMQGLASPTSISSPPSSDVENKSASGDGEKPAVQRDSTMTVTAKEGIAFLEASNEQKLLEMQDLTNPPVSTSQPPLVVDTQSPKEGVDKPVVQRDNTMEVTAKEAERLLGKNKPDDDAKTRGQQQQIDTLKDEPPAKKPKMAKGVTMVGTAKEAAAILGDDKPDADAMTRGQQKQIDAITKETPASPTKKGKMSKHTTMVGTAKEAKELLGNEKLGDTRAETKKKGRPSGPKRTSTIAKTMQEATYVVPDINVEEGRRTRSQSGRGDKPGMKRAGTMQQTAKEGKEYLKRGKKSKKVEPVPEEDEEEEDAE